MSTFVLINRRHNTPGVQVAQNGTDQEWPILLYAARPANADPVNGVTTTLHVTQKSTGLSCAWVCESPHCSFRFRLPPSDELWVSSDTDTVVWAVWD